MFTAFMGSVISVKKKNKTADKSLIGKMRYLLDFIFMKDSLSFLRADYHFRTFPWVSYQTYV